MDKNKIIIFVLVSFLLYFILRGVDFTKAYDSLLSANPYLIVLAFLIELSIVFLWNYEWILFIREFAPARFFTTLPILFGGTFVNNITPGVAVGGEPVKAHFLSKIYKNSSSEFLATTLFVVTLNAVVSTVFSLVALFTLSFFLDIPSLYKLFIEVCLVLFSIFLVSAYYMERKFTIKRLNVDLDKILPLIYHSFFFSKVRLKFKSLIQFEKFIIRKIDSFFLSAEKIMKDKHSLNKEILISVLIWFIAYIKTYVIFLAFGYSIDPFIVFLVVTLGRYFGLLSTMPGGVVVTETSMISLYILFGVDPELALVVTLLDRFISYFHSIIIGYVSLLYINFKYD